MTLEDLVIAVHQLLDAEQIPHGFGGALALNLYADPRATRDIDISAFVPWEHRAQVIAVFEQIGYTPERPPEEALPVAGVRLWADPSASPFPIDVFFALDERYDRVRQRLVAHPFGPDLVPIPFYSAEDVILFKLSFNRDKDWVDIRRMVQEAPPLDLDYIEEQLVAIRGPAMYPRVARLRAMVEAGGELR
ncbi:MAG: nucleotidyl transferase AbiEii/AbiGii toxin family protein [Acidimicrobiales bacterium]